MSDAQVLEDPEVKETGTGDDLFHYVDKAKITESAVLGTPAVALCGYVFAVTKTPKPGSPVCPQCKEIFESLPKGG
jgi:predicted Zn-ribbon and HTH transcriptional regulator